MTAFLKIDRCTGCQSDIPWDWVPPIALKGKPLTGTGTWKSALDDGLCGECVKRRDDERRQTMRLKSLRERFIEAVGGMRPYREFTFGRYDVTAGNGLAVQMAKGFDRAQENLYLWGRCGVGKTHLAVAILRDGFAQGASIAMTTPFQLIRRLRMKAPEEEQRVIDRFILADLVVLDDLGAGSESAYTRQTLQEILDGRHYRDAGGLVITSQCSLSALTVRLHDCSIPSRLAGMCQVIEIRGPDRRCSSRRSDV